MARDDVLFEMGASMSIISSFHLEETGPAALGLRQTVPGHPPDFHIKPLAWADSVVGQTRRKVMPLVLEVAPNEASRRPGFGPAATAHLCL